MAHLTSVGVSFDLSDEQRELQALAHEFAERELRPDRARMGRSGGLPARPPRPCRPGRAELACDPGRVRGRRCLAGHLGDRGRGALVGLCRSRRPDRRHDVPGAAAARRGNRRAAPPLAPSARVRGRLLGGDRLHRARRGLGRGGDPDERAPRRRRLCPERREVLRHERRHRRAHDRVRPSRRRHLRVPARAGRPRRVSRPEGTQARPARVLHGLDPARGRAHSRRPAARRAGRGLRDRDGLLPPLASPGGRIGGRDRACRLRVRHRLCQRAAGFREAADGEAGRLVQAGGHGDADRGLAAPRLACRRCARDRRRGRACSGRTRRRSPPTPPCR